jgi:hypothetical protein
MLDHLNIVLLIMETVEYINLSRETNFKCFMLPFLSFCCTILSSIESLYATCIYEILEEARELIEVHSHEGRLIVLMESQINCPELQSVLEFVVNS